MNKKNNIDYKKNIFFILMLSFSLLYSVLIPLCQVPDEPTHLESICNSIGLEGVNEQYLAIGQTYIQDVIFDQKKIEVNTYLKCYSVNFDYSIIKLSGFPKLSVLKYLPQLPGLFLGLLLHLPVMICIHLMEFSAAIISTIICLKAYELMPVKKELFMAIMLLPMCLQQYGSLNYDATLIPLSFLAVAMILNMEMKTVTSVNWIGLITVIILIGLTKPPYAVLILLAVILLFKKKNNSDNVPVTYLIIGTINLGLLGIVGLYLLRNVSRISILDAVIMNLPHYFNLFKQSVKMEWWLWLQEVVGYLGWLNTKMPPAYIWFVIISLFVFAFMKNDNNNKISKMTRLVSLIIVVIVFHLIMISMISHSFMIHGLPYDSLQNSRESLTLIASIQGVQGRYFIPILMNFYLIFGADLIGNKKFIKIFQITYYVIAMLVPIVVIVQKYWIF